jgi:hypothetical protein
VSGVPVIIKPGDEVVFVLNGTHFNFGKLAELSVETVTPPPIIERLPRNAEEIKKYLRGHRFFEQGLGTVTSVVKFTFEKSTCYVPAGDTDTPDSSSD